MIEGKLLTKHQSINNLRELQIKWIYLFQTKSWPSKENWQKGERIICGVVKRLRFGKYFKRSIDIVSRQKFVSSLSKDYSSKVLYLKQNFTNGKKLSVFLSCYGVGHLVTNRKASPNEFSRNICNFIVQVLVARGCNSALSKVVTWNCKSILWYFESIKRAIFSIKLFALL